MLGALAALTLAGSAFSGRSVAHTSRKRSPSPVVPTPACQADPCPRQRAPDCRRRANPRAQQRFFRYDRNRNLKIPRDEMLSTRFCDFRKFDKGGYNLLAFEEWTAARADRFGSSDANHDDWLWQAEFATTAPNRKPKAKCSCTK